MYAATYGDDPGKLTLDLYVQRINHAQMMQFWQRGDKDATQNHAQTKAMRQDALFKALNFTPTN